MNNDLKFPLTAAVGFLLGGILFYPWNMAYDSASLSSVAEQTAELETPNLNKLIVKKIEYQFDALELNSSNSTIKNQLKNKSVVEHKANKLGESVNEDAIAMAKYLSELKQQPGIKQKIEVQKTIYRFPARLLSFSNLAIKKQLAGYHATDVSSNTQPININQLEVAENSETGKFVKNVADLSNPDSDKPVVKIAQARPKLKIKHKTPTKFSKSQVKISNLAIKKQLRSYRAVVDDNTNNNKMVLSNVDIDSELTPVPDDIDIENPVVESSTQANQEIESELLLSNTEIDDEDNDDEDFSRVLVYMNPNYRIDSGFKSDHSLHGEEDDDEEDFSQVLAYSNPNYANAELDDDEDEDEYGSERVVFNHEPYYFIENFENNLNNSLTGKNFDVPNIENIHENSNSDLTAENAESEMVIEEINFDDDGKIVTSASN